MALEREVSKLANAIGCSNNETRGLTRWEDTRNADGASSALDSCAYYYIV